MILFKTDERLKKEFEEDINPRLKIILFALAEMLDYSKLGTLVITHLIRTQAEQDAIYMSMNMKESIRTAYMKKKWRSVHQKGRGADISVANLKNPQEITDWLNANFRYSSRNFKPTCILEDLGHGSHLHLQCSAMGTTLK